jgi:integrase
MLVTGLRRGELLALKWSDIDEVNKVITVSDNLTNEGIGTTKSNKVHYVPLSNAAENCLKGFKKQLEKEGNPAIWINDLNLIFVGKEGKPIKPHSLNNVFRRIQNIGVDASPHSMRHTFVYYSKNKLSLSELKDTLGHDESTSTLDIYGDMLFDASSVAHKIDAIFNDVKFKNTQVKANNIVSFEDLKKRAK